WEEPEDEVGEVRTTFLISLRRKVFVACSRMFVCMKMMRIFKLTSDRELYFWRAANGKRSL
ncbi:MAG: hypothetical protein ACOVQ0_14460, partial [Novosphingobium sp.]|uniref:hypothetical protein n=1 Tax=Novosphingobium sp. TaxID=1874826 RepID=UPI003B99707C